MSYYKTVYTGGESNDPQWMSIYLYPDSDVEGTCKQNGTVADALRYACDKLVNFAAIDYYEILRFKIDDYTPPDSIYASSSSVESEFIDYLEGDGDPANGTGDNLYSLTGVHQLIHGEQNACDEDSGGYAPYGAGGQRTTDKQTAFTEGLAAWSPVCDYNHGLTKNAAIQECLHMFLADAWDDPWTGSEDDQHSLGTVNKSYYNSFVTPLLTYHWDDEDQIGDGECPPDQWYAADHQKSPTDCTKKAMRKTADKEIPSNL